MRPVSADLLYAQQQRGAAWRVAAYTKPRSTFAGDPFELHTGFANVWPAGSHPYQIPGQSCDLTACACAGQAGGVVLHAVRSDAAGKVGMHRFVYNGQTLSNTSVTDLVSLVSPYPAGQRGSTPGIAQANGRVRLVYADGARVWCLISADDGCTWSTPTLLYDGTGLYVRYSNFALRPDSSGRWVLGYSAWTASGQARVRGAHDTGTGWVNWPVCPTTVDWQVAGLPGAAAAQLTTQCAFYLWGRNYTWSTLAVGSVTLLNGAFVSWWDALQTVDRAGLEGESGYDRVRTGEGYGAYWLTMQEGPPAGRRYWVRAALWGGPGGAEMEEPVLLSDEDADASISPYEHLHCVPVSGTQYLLLLGAAIYAVLNNDVGNSVGTLEVVGYRYYQHVGGGGRVDLQVRPGCLSVVSGTLRSSLPVHPGDVLELVRVVSALDAAGQAVGGTDSRIFRVVSVTHRVERTDVVAYDGPGVLWDHHLRRARILRAGDRTRADDLRALIVWAGLKPDSIDLPDPNSLSPGFVASADQALGSAVVEYLRDVAALLRPGRLETGGIVTGHPSVSIVPAAAGEPSLHLLRWRETDSVCAVPVHRIEGERLTESASDGVIAVAWGMLSTDPTQGEDWRVQIAATSGYGRVRPHPLVRRNRRWTGTTLQAVVAADAAKAQAGRSRIWVHCPAHLGVELWDVAIAHNGVDTGLRVTALDERFSDGRIEQEIGLC